MIRSRFSINTRYVVGMVASFTSKKDQATFIRAAKKIIHFRQDTTFILVGDGETMDTCQSLIDESEKNLIRFLGKLYDIESVINLFDIGILATFTEWISNSIMEYMALAKPVVATDCDGNSELMVDGETGYLIKPGDPEDLSNKVLSLLDDEPLRRTMGSLGKQRLITYFSLDAMVSAYLTIYNRYALI